MCIFLELSSNWNWVGPKTDWNDIQINGTALNFRSADIRDGVGELYVRSIMAYVYRLEGRLEVSFDNLRRCGEVIIKYPGLCRFTSW